MKRQWRSVKEAAVCIGLVLGFLAGGRSSVATMIGGTDFNIEYWAGTGSSQAVLVIDFRATDGDFYCFGFRFDGDATGYDMIQAVAAAGDLDYQATTFPGFGTYIDNFSYGTDVGNVDYWWQYFVGVPEDGSVTWTPASEGMSTRILADGSIDGWYNGFDGRLPRVPEPASIFLLVGAAALLPRGLRGGQR